MEDPGRFFQLLNFALGKAGGGNAPLHPTKLFHQLLHLLVLHANPRGLLPHVRNELHLPSPSLKACRQKCDNSQQPALKSADKSRWLKGFQNKKLEFTSTDRGAFAQSHMGSPSPIYRTPTQNPTCQHQIVQRRLTIKHSSCTTPWLESLPTQHMLLCPPFL